MKYLVLVRILFFFFLFPSLQSRSQSAGNDAPKDGFILPVTWLSFTAVPQQSNILVSWTVDNDQGESSFAVEYSKDGNNWSTLSLVKVEKDGVQQHEWIHYNPGVGLHYYRIYCRESGGMEYYSRTVVVKKTESPVVRFYPNPVTNGTLNICLSEKSAVNIYGVNGRLVLSQHYESGQHTLFLSQLAEGAYWLQVGGSTSLLRIGKQ